MNGLVQYIRVGIPRRYSHSCVFSPVFVNGVMKDKVSLIKGKRDLMCKLYCFIRSTYILIPLRSRKGSVYE